MGSAPAVRFAVFSGSFEDALESMDFEKDPAGHWGVLGRTGSFARGEKCQIGAFNGLRAEPWFRGYAKPGAKLHDQVGVYDATHIVMVLRSKAGITIGIAFQRSYPEALEEPKPESAARRILESLARERAAN